MVRQSQEEEEVRWFENNLQAIHMKIEEAVMCKKQGQKVPIIKRH